MIEYANNFTGKFGTLMGGKLQETNYEDQTDPVTEIGSVNISWEFTIDTDRTIKAYQPDIVNNDCKNKMFFHIDKAFMYI